MNKNLNELKLSKNLRFLISERGMTVVALSRKTGVPLQTLHGWLYGVEPRSVRQIKLVAEYFGNT
jgi:predicted transcriptional regulator